MHTKFSWTEDILGQLFVDQTDYQRIYRHAVTFGPCLIELALFVQKQLSFFTNYHLPPIIISSDFVDAFPLAGNPFWMLIHLGRFFLLGGVVVCSLGPSPRAAFRRLLSPSQGRSTRRCLSGKVTTAEKGVAAFLQLQKNTSKPTDQPEK